MTEIFSTWGGDFSVKPMPSLFNGGQQVQALMGWDGVIIRDESVDIVDMTREFAARAYAESCGQCFPCRMGTAVMVEILERICAGEGRSDDLERLAKVARYISDAARCDIGRTSPKPILDAITHFPEQFERAIREAQPRPRGKFVSRVTAPCIAACPAHVDIPGYVEQIRFDRPDRALDLVRETCSLPGTIGRVCVHYCEMKCRRGQVDESVAIRALKRYAADRELAVRNITPIEPKLSRQFRDKKVAIVGAGPAGLACAYYLALEDYRATLFEALPEPGGMAAVGIPDYRLPRHILRNEAAWVEELGAEIRYGIKIGEDITLADLMGQGFSAVFIAAGAPGYSSMGCEGEDAGFQGFMPGVNFLRHVAFGEKPLTGRRIAIVGGGNVAMDCVRSALRLGFDEVNLLYRRTVKEMPADPAEIEESLEEGVKFHTLVAPVKIRAHNNRVTGIECIRMELGDPDASGRRRPVPVKGSNYIIECDAVVSAIGQVCELDKIVSGGIMLGRNRTLEVDPVTMQSRLPRIFGGGDCVTGPSTLINALAAGRRAAHYIVQYMESGECTPEKTDLLDLLISDLACRTEEEPPPCTAMMERQRSRVADPHTRIADFSEVESGLSTFQARIEARRCLRCYRLALAAFL